MSTKGVCARMETSPEPQGIFLVVFCVFFEKKYLVLPLKPAPLLNNLNSR
jgi:hypothetical protein